MPLILKVLHGVNEYLQNAGYALVQPVNSIEVLSVRSAVDVAAAASLMRDLMAANIALYPAWRERILAVNKGR